MDNLVDYARAAWFAYVTNLPGQDSASQSTDELSQEVAALRAKLLMWATPLVGAGFFEESAVARIREGSGLKDSPSDLVALVGLFRSRWDDVKGICGVTDADLERGSRVGPELFARLSRRDFPNLGSASDGSLRVRRAWTLLDRAYGQCRRAVAYLRAEEGDVDTLLPSLRRNPGPPGSSARSSSSSAPTPATPGTSRDGAAAPAPTTGSAPPPPSGLRSLDAGPVINAGVPFAAKP